MVKGKKNEDSGIDKNGEAMSANDIKDQNTVHTGEHDADDNESGHDERRSSDRRRAERRKDERRKDTPHIEDPEVVALREKLAEREDALMKIQGEANSMKDLLQRRQADFENYKKRMVKMQEDNKKYAVRDFALEIIQINDDLLRAIEASGFVMQNGASCDDSHSSFVQGVSMISRRIEDMLGQFGIIEIEAQGQEFDPNFHEAVEIEMREDVDKDTVTLVHQKGFRIDDLVIRSSKVKVSKAVKKSNGEQERSS